MIWKVGMKLGQINRLDLDYNMLTCYTLELVYGAYLNGFKW